VIPGLFLLAVSLPAVLTGQNRAGPGGRLALVGGTIYPSPNQDPIRDGIVVVEDGRIAAVGRRGAVRVPQGARTLDCAGLTIAAGFWNSHVHFLQRKWADADTIPAAELAQQLQAMLTRYGFTSVFDTWSAWRNTRRIRERVESGEVAGPRIRSTGEAIFGPGVGVAPASWAALGFMSQEGFQTARVSEAEDALAAAKTLIDAGTDGLKFYAATPGAKPVVVPEPAIRAGVQEAHLRGKPVFAHPSSAAGLLASVRAGVDVLSHTTPQSGPWDAVTLAAMKQGGVALIPTLKLWTYEFRHERGSRADVFVKTASEQLRAWSAAGGVVLFGTDVGYMSEYDPTDEYILMAESGLSVRQLLASLTTAPAERFGAARQLGRIAPGLSADLTVLGGDPSNDVRAFANVKYTIRDGNIIYASPR
jgi:imidazolonepropionase-like amidohydrolase